MAHNKTNPNGANQYQLDARQKICWEYYINPKSKTFGNATQSAIKAGYTEGTADTITVTEWFAGKLWRLNSVETAEKKFKQLLELEILDDKGRVDVGVARIQADLAKFVANTQGKDKGYSTRQELTGAEGEQLFNDEQKAKGNKAIQEFVNGDTE